MSAISSSVMVRKPPPPVPQRGSRALGGRLGDTIMALTPFIALGLFFWSGFNGGFAWSWLWFFLVPVVAIVIYGPGGKPDRET